MLKLKNTQKKAGLIIVITSVLLIAVIITIILCYGGGNNSSEQKLIEKIRIAAETNRISEEKVKKDKTLMAQINMEIEQEEKIDSLTKDITVTDKDIENYRNMIGNTMDTKKAVLILFNTAEECQAFITEHGLDSNPVELSMGTLPLMEKDEDSNPYYNIVGNEILEKIFDSLKDGEYSKTPIEFSGVYCYLKRIGISSPMQSDDKIIELIKSEKAHEKLNEGR